ncbi:hypothetical protein [Mesorhizobium neociceri]|uniref:Uncharacterized protein n=1 Tax=Mesorhizobium neociceri TaxID=1307853 RepID=A0A838B736_9HYPH|nr:hypothetical protein [Mesorhizobium neociceri]MBA1141729.1 hypothetical protein [Mesorhizobium neociceri]
MTNKIVAWVCFAGWAVNAWKAFEIIWPTNGFVAASASGACLFFGIWLAIEWLEGRVL